MPKATIEFNLPEEQNDYYIANIADKMYSCLWNLEQEMRGVIKYGHKYKDVEELAQYVREMIYKYVDLYDTE